MKQILVFALLSCAALAGCTGQETSSDTADVPVLEDALVARAAGNATANLALRGEWSVSGGQEADACGGFLVVDRLSIVQILEVRHDGDETEFIERGSSTAVPAPVDVKWSSDCRYIFVGDDEELSIAPLAGTATAGGIYVVDAQDKDNLDLVTYFPVGPRRGPHMVGYHQLSDGTELVFGANADISINRFDRDAGTLTELARYAPDYITEVQRTPDTFDVYYQTFAHDMFVYDDASGSTLMVVANWDAGVRIVDVSDPAAPVELGAWNDFPAGHSGNVHTVSTEWIGDRRITVAAVEIGFALVGGVPYALNEERPVVYVLDSTDPAAITLLGTWENPDGLRAGRSDIGEPLYSTHNLQLENGKVYLAHYGLGVWILDITTPELQAAPHVLAYHDADGMNTWDVVLHQGVLYSSGGPAVQALQVPWLEVGPVGISSRA